MTANAINPYYQTAAISGLPEHRDNTKVFRILYVTHNTPGDWTLYVDYYVDFSANPIGTRTISMKGDSGIWGEDLWGSMIFGQVGTRRDRIILTDAVGKTVQFKFRVSGVGYTFKIKDLELEYNVRSKR